MAGGGAAGDGAAEDGAALAAGGLAAFGLTAGGLRADGLTAVGLAADGLAFLAGFSNGLAAGGVTADLAEPGLAAAAFAPVLSLSFAGEVPFFSTGAASEDCGTGSVVCGGVTGGFDGRRFLGSDIPAIVSF